MIELAVQIGFLEVRFLDVADILLVGVLLYYIFRLLKVNIALNIFLGIALIYLAWFIVRELEMNMLSSILGQFIGLGVIALVIVFQPEIRRFLLYLGRGRALSKNSFWQQFILRKQKSYDREIQAILSSVERLAQQKTGALLVFPQTSKLQVIAETGIFLHADISEKLIESIFQKNSPLHDGAILIDDGKIVAASCILPISENVPSPPGTGTRHKAGISMTEKSDAFVIIVSEETGEISIAEQGELNQDVTSTELKRHLMNVFYGVEKG